MASRGKERLCRPLGAGLLLCIVLQVVLLLPAAAGDVCVEQQKVVGSDTKPGDKFGGAVSIDGNLMVSVAANEDGAGEDAGAVYVYIREGVKWRQEVKLVGNDTAKKHHFGRSVSISGDSVAIGARTWEGAVYVFVRELTNWGLQWNEQAKLEAKDKRGGDEFGRSVAISGNLMVVGAPNGNADIGNFAGAAYIFSRGGIEWSQTAKIWGSDTKGGHYFGDAVAISGGTVVVGTSAQILGAVYVFTDAKGSWKQEARIFRAGAFGGDLFGASLAIYKNHLAVGAPGDDEQLNDAGAAYVFARTPATTQWVQERKVIAADRTEGDRFGTFVGISEYTLAVSAEGPKDQAGGFGGSVYVFAQLASNWTQQMKFEGKDVKQGDRFGASISVSGNYVATGAPRKTSFDGLAAGAAYLHKCVTTTTTTTKFYDWEGSSGQGDSQGANVTKAITSFAGRRARISSSLAGLTVLSLLASCL